MGSGSRGTPGSHGVSGGSGVSCSSGGVAVLGDGGEAGVAVRAVQCVARLATTSAAAAFASSDISERTFFACRIRNCRAESPRSAGLAKFASAHCVGKSVNIFQIAASHLRIFSSATRAAAPGMG